MSAAPTKFPATHQELLELGKGELVRWPATFAEYWDLLGRVPYKADYSNQEIIAMSYETQAHSKIVTEIMFLLRKIFDAPEFSVHDPNRPVYIAEFQAVHNPDCSVVLEPAQLFDYQPGMNAETTPLVLVEVLSKTTRDYDFSEKLPHYKQIPTLRQIIYLESASLFATVFERDSDSSQWTATEYNRPEDAFTVYDRLVTLEEIYRKVRFD